MRQTTDFDTTHSVCVLVDVVVAVVVAVVVVVVVVIVISVDVRQWWSSGLHTVGGLTQFAAAE